MDAGIPLTEGFFRGEVVDGGERVSIVDGTAFLRIGHADDPRGYFGVSCESGAIYYLMPHGSFLANSSPRQFAESLEAYVSVTTDESVVDDAEAVAAELRSLLSVIDAIAMEDPGSLWNDVLSDVVIGIYGE